MTMADTVAVMNKGAIEQMGAPEELYELPRTAFVANFLGQSNLFTGDGRRRRATSIVVDIAGAQGRGARASAPSATRARSRSACDPRSSTLHTRRRPPHPELNVARPGPRHRRLVQRA